MKGININKKLVFGIGGSVIGCSVVFLTTAIVVSSCSNSDGSSNRSDKFNGFQKDTLDNYGKDFVDVKTHPSHNIRKISQKNVDFVNQINKDNPILSQEEENNLKNVFNSLNSNQIEKMFKDALSIFSNYIDTWSVNNSQSDSGLPLKTINKNIWEISNFKYDISSKEVSFVIKQGWQNSYESSNVKANGSITLAFEFKNIKIELGFINVNGKKVASIVPSENQGSNASLTFLKNQSSGLFDMNSYKKIYASNFDPWDFDLVENPWNFYRSLVKSIEYIQREGKELGLLKHHFIVESAGIDTYSSDQCIVSTFFGFQTTRYGVEEGLTDGYGVRIVNFNSNGELKPDLSGSQRPSSSSTEFGFIPFTDPDSGDFLIYQ